MVGYAFMGAAHSQAWRTVAGSSTHRCRRSWSRSAAVTRQRRAVLRRLGRQSSVPGCEELVERPDIDAAISALRLAGLTNIAAANRHHARDSSRPLDLLKI